MTVWTQPEWQWFDMVKISLDSSTVCCFWKPRTSSFLRGKAVHQLCGDLLFCTACHETWTVEKKHEMAQQHISEWVSRFLMAHQHTKGHSVLYKMTELDVSYGCEWCIWREKMQHTEVRNIRQVPYICKLIRVVETRTKVRNTLLVLSLTKKRCN